MKAPNTQKGPVARLGAAALSTLAFALALVAALVAAPAPALADYSIDSVRIDADVAPDGSMVVTESRTFDFDGSYHGVYWDIPQGTYNGRDVTVDVLECGLADEGGFAAFSHDDSERSGSYQTYEIDGGALEIKLFSNQEDSVAVFRVKYRISGVTSAWADTGELYWKFVSDGWDVPSGDVACTVTLPVPDGESGKVRAWAHGPLNGEVTVNDDGATFTVPTVGTEEFAEARICFPVEWLSEMTPSSDSRLDKIMSEEKNWAEEANAKRVRARILVGGVNGVGIAVPIMCLAVALFSLKKYKDSHRAQFDDEYFRDVPTDDHPTVLGALYNGNGTPEGKEFTAALMSLSDQRAISLDVVQTKDDSTARRKRKDKGLLGGKKNDYRVTRTPRADAVTDPIDKKTLDFLFTTIAPLTGRSSMDADGNRSLVFGKLEKVAEDRPSTYSNAMESWKGVVEGRLEATGYTTDVDGSARARAFVAGALAILVGVVLGLVGLLVLGSGASVAVIVAGGLCGALSIVLGVKMRPLSREAIEVMAKLKALRRWLCDFTRLKEAVPSDVVLWNKLLVMAVVLGVSDEVIKQLRVAMPELLENEAFLPAYYWCYGYGDMRPPARAFTETYESAALINASELASSSDSSSSGGGGGFSGGGGGGFGGGGGGGAF